MLLVAAVGFLLAAGPGPWESNGPVYPAIDLITIAPDDESVVYAGAHDPASGKSALFRSRDGGTSWETVAQAPAGETLQKFAIDPTGPERMIALTKSADGVHGQMYRSDDGGLSWRFKALYIASDFDDIFFDTVDPNTAYFLSTGLRRSENDGAWTEIQPPVANVWISPSGELFWSALVYPQAPRVPYPFPLPPPAWETFTSTTQGRTSIYVSFADHPNLTSVAFAPTDTQIAYASCGALCMSVDGGAHWSSVESDDLASRLGNLAHRHVGVIAVDCEEAGDLFLTIVSTDASLLLRSEDAGVHWTVIPVPADPTGPLAFSPSGRSLYVGTDSGVYRLSLTGTRTLAPRD